jgi:hypothetical protein
MACSSKPNWYLPVGWFSSLSVVEFLCCLQIADPMMVSSNCAADLPPTLHNIPVVMLSSSQPMKVKSLLADDANAKRIDIARLYPCPQ